MTATPMLFACVLLAACTARGDQDSSRVAKTAVIPASSTSVVITEGDFEPRSIGSYSLRVYAGTNPRFPFDDFIAGMVLPRNGEVADVRFSDLDGDGHSDIIVVIHSVGTGGYLSADAIRLQGGRLTLLSSVSDLARDVDPVQALDEKFRTHDESLGGPRPQ